MIVISSKVIGTDIVLNDNYCDYRKHTDEVIIDLDRLKELLENMYTYGESGCKQFDSIEYDNEYIQFNGQEMTLDKAIVRYTSNAEYERTHGSLQGCLEFRQLAEWLKDYKRLKEQEPTGHWIVNEWGNISCSECGCTALYDKVYPGESVFGKSIRVKSTFCPTCGVMMVKSYERSEE